MEKFDVIIVGAGQAGNPLSTAFASKKKTALIERKYVGGTCINYGCTPTKAMVASAQAAYSARRAADYGVQTGEVSVSLASVRERKDRIVASFREGSESRIRKSPTDLMYGQAAFTGQKTMEVELNDGGERQLSAETIILDTGGRPRIPNLAGLDGVPYLDSTTIMELNYTPDHLLVLGGGYVGLEFAQMFRRFGSRVTVLQRGGQLVSREDEDVAAALCEILEGEGIDVILNADAQRVSRDSSGMLSLVIKTPDGERTLSGSHLLIAAGRTPNTDALNLPAAGVETDEHGYIRVNERLETNIPGIFATGDVKGGPAFTHIAYDDYRVLKANLLEGKDTSIKGRYVPYVLYTDPQLGRIGLTETQAREKGLNFRVAKMPMSSVARAIEVDRQRGFLKAVVDADTGQILGAACLGVEGGELMSMIEIAMMGKLPYPALRDGIFAHPTLAEVLNNLFGGLG